MDPAAERRQQHEAPVAELVAEPLDDDPLVRWQGPGRLALVLEIGDEVLGSPGIEVVELAQSADRRRPAARAPAEIGLDLRHECPERSAELDRPADGIAVPERQLAGNARRRRDGDPVVRDLLDPPAARPERDHLAGPALVDHLLVQLADPPPGRARLADHEHAEQPAVRDRPAARDRDDAGVAAAGDHVGRPVPGHARLQLGELVAWIGTGQHPEDALEDLSAEGLVRRRAIDRREQVVDGPGIHHGHRHDLLGEDVKRVARDLGGFDRALVHAPGDDRRLEEVAAVLREDHALARRADLVAGPPDPLQPTGDAGRRFDLDDQVDRAHVDAQLQ